MKESVYQTGKISMVNFRKEVVDWCSSQNIKQTLDSQVTGGRLAVEIKSSIASETGFAIDFCLQPT